MSFVRPELRAAAWRWREALSGAAIIVLGVLVASRAGWVASGAGALLIATGGAVAGLGWQRGRFRLPGDGPGLVLVTEGQVTYFGPLTGGSVALETLTSVVLDPSGHPVHFRLADADGGVLDVPVTAAGADMLLDAFAQLPGFRTEAMLRAMARPGTVATVIWRRAGAGPDVPQASRRLPGLRRLH